MRIIKIITKLVISLLLGNGVVNANSLENYPGFKDLKPGLHYEDVLEICPLLKDKTDLSNIYPNGGLTVSAQCYGIDDITFTGNYTKDLVLRTLTLSMGPIPSIYGTLLPFDIGDSNIYLEMKKIFDEKYTLEYSYSDKERYLLNESDIDWVWRVYEKGQVAFQIVRKEINGYVRIGLFIHYNDPRNAKQMMKLIEKEVASDDDF